MESLSFDRVVTITVLVFVIISALYRRIAKVGCQNLPPGPVGLPILGNLLQLGALPHRTLRKLADKYGDIMYLRLGSAPAVVVSSYDKAMLFLKTHDAAFASRPVSTAGDVLFENKAVLTTPHGDLWRRMRKLCVTEMLSPKRLESFKHIQYEQVAALVRDLWEASSRGEKAVNMSVALADMLSKASLRMLAGRTYKGDALKLADGSTLVFKPVLHEGTDVIGGLNIGDVIPFLKGFDLQRRRRKAQHVKDTLHYIFGKLIEDHLQNPLPTDADDANDFVDVMLQMLRKEPLDTMKQTIKCMMLDMLGATSETTSITLEWAMSEVATNPKILSKLQQEIDTVVAQNGGILNQKAVGNMKYVHCVIKETLRLHPPFVLGIPHESTKAVTVDGFRIPEKTQLIMNLWAIGTDPRVWKNSDKFEPERFMADESIDSSALTSEVKMLPLSGGRRGCPGVPMAAPMLKVCLAALIFAFDWVLAPQDDDGLLDMTKCLGVNFRLLPRLRHESRLALIHE